MPCKLSVNVNAIAYLRNRRHVPWPDLVEIGRLVLKAGAVGLTVGVGGGVGLTAGAGGVGSTVGVGGEVGLTAGAGAVVVFLAG